MRWAAERRRDGRRAAAAVPREPRPRPVGARPPRPRACGSSLKKRLDVAADDPAAGARAAHLAQVDLRRRGHLPRQRAGLDPAAAPAAVSSRGLLAVARRVACLTVGRCRWRVAAAAAGVAAALPLAAGCGLAAQTQRLGDLLGVFALLGQHHHPLAQRDFVAGGVVDVDDRAVVVRLHRHRGLVGLDVGQESPSLTWSPTLTSHCAITPVSIVGLSLGIVTSIGTSLLPDRSGERTCRCILTIQDIVDRRDDPLDRGEHRGFERPVVRDRRVLGGDAADRGVELVEDAPG